MDNLTEPATKTLKYEMNIYELIAFFAIYSTLFVIGVTGNSLVLLVTKKWKHKAFLAGQSTAMIFIKALCWIDLAVCLFILPIDMYRLAFGGNFTEGDNPLHPYGILIRVRNTTLFIEGFITVFIAYDRYRMVCQQPKGKPPLSTFQTRVLMVASVLCTMPSELLQFIMMIHCDTAEERFELRRRFRIAYYALYYATGILLLIGFYTPVVIAASKTISSISMLPLQSYASSSGSGTVSTGIDPVETATTKRRLRFQSSSSEAGQPTVQQAQRRGRQALKVLAYVTALFISAQLFPICTTFGLVPAYATIQNLFYIQNVGNPLIYVFISVKFRKQLLVVLPSYCGCLYLRA